MNWEIVLTNNSATQAAQHPFSVNHSKANKSPQQPTEWKGFALYLLEDKHLLLFVQVAIDKK